MSRRKNRTQAIILSIVFLMWFSIFSTSSIQMRTGNSKFGTFLLELNDLSEEDLVPDQQYRMIVLFRSGVEVNQFLNRRSSDLIILKRFKIIPALLILATPVEVAQIRDFKGITGIWLDQRINYLPAEQTKIIDVPSESTLKTESSGMSFNLTKFHETYNGSNVIVAVLDTGIDPTHLDLNDQDDNENTNESKVINGVSFVEMEPYYLGDFNGHGTYVAGIIAGTGNASNGLIRGIAPGAMLMNVKVLASTGEGYQSWIISGIEYAINHGSDIIAMCFSGPGFPGDPLCQAIDAAVKQGVVVITAAGDDGPSYGSIGSPGLAYSAITIGNYNQISGTVAQNSSRGPIFDLRSGPDLIAPGVNITSCRVNTADNPLQYELPEFGTPIDGNYTNASGSFAAAAYVAGVSALLIQAFRLLDPVTLKLALQRNAYDLGENPNKQGRGVIDINTTFNYLNQTYGEDPLVTNRLYTPALPYFGFIGTGNLTILNILFNRTTSINCSIGSYADFGGLYYYNKTDDFNTTHLLLGRFGVKYNNQSLKWFSDMRVLREMHHVIRGFYDRSVSILTDDTLLYTIVIESWDFINTTDVGNPVRNITGFKISITIHNLLNTRVSDISIFNWWKMDLFFNETNYAIDDFGVYNDTDDIIYANDTYESSSTAAYIGFKSYDQTSMCEVESNTTTLEDVKSDNLKNPNFQYYSGGDVGLASKWIIEDLNPYQSTNFSGALGLGNSYNALKDQVNWILYNTSSFNVTDLVVCDFKSSISRMTELGNSINTDILVINIGTLPVTNSTTKFVLNSSNFNYQITFTNKTLQPYQFQQYYASALPLTTGLFNFSWYTINTTYSDISDEITYEEAIKRDNQPLDNIFCRNMFIYEKKQVDLENGTLIFPSSLIFEPLLVQIPGDSIIYNVSILSNCDVANLSFEITGNASNLITITPDYVENPNTYSFIEIEFVVPIFIEPGFYNATIILRMNNSFSKVIPVSFSIKNYTKIKGRVLFDTSHGSIGSLQEWDERLDSIYAKYFDFYQIAESNFYNVDELPYGSTVTSEVLRYYDTVIICDPERGYNTSEIEAYQNYVHDGGSIFIWAENSDECNISTLNSIISIFGLNITENTTEGIHHENLSAVIHDIAQNIDEIELLDSVKISVMGQALQISDHIALTNSSDDTNSKILLLGDSDLFANSHLTSKNNSRFVLNNLQWLMNDTLKMQVDIYSNYSSSIIYLGEKIHIAINVLVPNGCIAVNSEALLASAIIFPNGTVYYNYFSFYLRKGWHSMVFFTDVANQSGWYQIRIFVKHVAGVSFYNTSIPAFYVNASQISPIPGEDLDPPSGPIFPPVLGIVCIWGALVIVGVIWVNNTLKLKKKIKTLK